jgi:hypothetical protein
MPLLPGLVFTAPANVRGFDANQKIGPKTAAAFRRHGYSFCIRYVRRKKVNAHDLSPAEAKTILGAGLGLMPVQHVESESSWLPTPAKGDEFGQTAADDAERIGFPPGITLWCDLEGVAKGTPSAQVIEYCNRWHSRVAAAGYVPGVYLGFRYGMSATQAFKALRFTRYWGAFNLNKDEEPIVRGLLMRQAERKPADVPPGTSVDFQTDKVRKDKLGGLPTLLAPDTWLD